MSGDCDPCRDAALVLASVDPLRIWYGLPTAFFPSDADTGNTDEEGNAAAADDDDGHDEGGKGVGGLIPD